jgi:hypothetical protein
MTPERKAEIQRSRKWLHPIAIELLDVLETAEEARATFETMLEIGFAGTGHEVPSPNVLLVSFDEESQSWVGQWFEVLSAGETREEAIVATISAVIMRRTQALRRALEEIISIAAGARYKARLSGIPRFVEMGELARLALGLDKEGTKPRATSNFNSAVWTVERNGMRSGSLALR